MSANCKNKIVQLSLPRYKTQKLQLTIKDVPCFCCNDNIACFEPQKCDKLSHWLGLPTPINVKEQAAASSDL
jgi:hypothetical protein